MSSQLNVFIASRIGLTNQTIWLQNIDRLPIFIDWGDGSPLEASGDVNNEYISHTYSSAGTYNIFAFYQGLWGDDLGNALTTSVSAASAILIEESDVTIIDGITIRDPIVYTNDTLNNSFLSLSLPNTTIEIGSNEFGVVDNINAIFKQIDDNTTYLINQTTIIDSTVKNTIVGWLSGGIGNNNLWNVDLPGWDTNFNTLTATSSFSNIVDIKIRETDTARYFYILDTSSVKVLDGKSVHANTVAQASAIGFNQLLTGLTAMDVDSFGNIYLLGPNILYRTQHSIINQNIVLQTQIGGIGLQKDRYMFNQASDMVIDAQDRIFVVDSNNLCIKVYNSNLVWMTTILYSQFSNMNRPIKICFNPVTNEISVLTTDRDFVTWDRDFNFVSSVNLLQLANSTDLQSSVQNDTINKVLTDRENHYFYVVTNNATVKFTRLGRLINKIQNPISTIFTSLKSGCVDKSGQLYIAKNDRIFQLLVPIVSIAINRSIPALTPLSGITLNSSGDEFVQDWVYNKSLKKILRNMVILNGSLTQKIVVSFDLDGSLRSFFVRPLESSERAVLLVNINNFIGINEFVMSDTINRVLKLILDYQIGILNSIKPKVVFIPSAIPYPVLP